MSNYNSSKNKINPKKDIHQVINIHNIKKHLFLNRKLEDLLLDNLINLTPTKNININLQSQLLPK